MGANCSQVHCAPLLYFYYCLRDLLLLILGSWSCYFSFHLLQMSVLSYREWPSFNSEVLFRQYNAKTTN